MQLNSTQHDRQYSYLNNLMELVDAVQDETNQICSVGSTLDYKILTTKY